MSFQSGGAVEQAAADFVSRQRWVLVGLYVVFFVVAIYSVFFAGFWVSFAIFFLAILTVLPTLTLRGESTHETDEIPSAVVEQLSTPRSVLTAMWFEQADEIEANPSDGSAIVRKSPWIGGERRYRIETERTDETTVQLSMSKNGNDFVETTIEVRRADSGSEVRIATFRRPVTGLWLFQILVLGSAFDELLAAAGYCTVEGSWSIRPRNPLGSG